MLRHQTQESYLTLLFLSYPIFNNLRNALGSTFKIYPDYPGLTASTAITLFHLMSQWYPASTLALLQWILNRAARVILLISVRLSHSSAQNPGVTPQFHSEWKLKSLKWPVSLNITWPHWFFSSTSHCSPPHSHGFRPTLLLFYKDTRQGLGTLF